MTTQTLTPVDDLWTVGIGTTSVSRDWDRLNWPEGFEFFEAPACPECGEYAVWSHGEWECGNGACECEERGIDPFEQDVSGPMMSYSYELTNSGRMGGGTSGQGWRGPHEAAALISHLPLCIIEFPEDDDLHLALTGGGMDLSWEICEAYMRLGWLPPAHFAELPAMAGRPRDDVDRWIIEGCKRTFRVLAGQAERALERLESLGT